MAFYGNTVYQDELYTITDDWRMYRTGQVGNPDIQHIGHLIGGKQVFQKKYKGDFQEWIKAVRKRELNTMHSYLAQAEHFNTMAEEIRAGNNFPRKG